MIVEWQNLKFEFDDQRVMIHDTHGHKMCFIHKPKPLHAAGIDQVEIEFSDRAECPHHGMWEDGDRSVWVPTEDVT